MDLETPPTLMRKRRLSSDESTSNSKKRRASPAAELTAFQQLSLLPTVRQDAPQSTQTPSSAAVHEIDMTPALNRDHVVYVASLDSDEEDTATSESNLALPAELAARLKALEAVRLGIDIAPPQPTPQEWGLVLYQPILPAASAEPSQPPSSPEPEQHVPASEGATETEESSSMDID